VGLCRTEHLLLRRPLRQVFADALVELLLCREVTNEIATLEVSRALWAHTDFVQQIAARLTRAKCDPRYSSFLRRLENLERALSDHFVGIIRMAQNRRVTIRLLDPPFAEFIREADLAEMVADGRIMEEDRAKIGRVFRQSHPMLSLRGARFAIAYPELCRMQVRAVMSAAVRVARETVQRQKIDFMLPFVVDAAEVAVWKDVIMAGLLGCEPNQVETALGVMIETPRSVLMAADIASKVDFLAFGTNDLSQLTWGYSRDDDGDFMSSSAYAWSAGRPFNSFDVEGVGQLIKLAVSSIRQQAARVRIGVCGEHAAMPEAIGFFVSCGVDYLSCVPRLVPEVRAFVGRAAASSFIRR